MHPHLGGPIRVLRLRKHQVVPRHWLSLEKWPRIILLSHSNGFSCFATTLFKLLNHHIVHGPVLNEWDEEVLPLRIDNDHSRYCDLNHCVPKQWLFFFIERYDYVCDHLLPVQHLHLCDILPLLSFFGEFGRTVVQANSQGTRLNNEAVLWVGTHRNEQRRTKYFQRPNQ